MVPKVKTDTTRNSSSSNSNPMIDVDTFTDENDNHDDEAVGILWEQNEKDLRSTRIPVEAERLRSLFQVIGIMLTLLLLSFLLVTGQSYDEGGSSGAMEIPPSPYGTESGHGNADNDGTVLVTGATGRLGALLYKELKQRGRTVRAFVRDADKARAVLGCSSCDEAEGIYMGDLTRPADLRRAFSDGEVTTLAVAAGASPSNTPEVRKAVEFDAVVESVRALGLSAADSQRDGLAVVFCSSMGTEMTPEPAWSGDILHWKLNAEAFLATSGIPATIVKPCGLPPDMTGKNATLVVGHHGTIMQNTTHHAISREDVASVMAEAVDLSRGCRFHRNSNLRFDLCSRPGPPTTDLKGLLESARWEWDRPGE